MLTTICSPLVLLEIVLRLKRERELSRLKTVLYFSKQRRQTDCCQYNNNRPGCWHASRRVLANESRARWWEQSDCYFRNYN